MRRATLVLLLAACAAALAAPSGAQATSSDQWVRVPVEVTAVAGRDLFLDRGREAGLAPDDRVEIQLAGEGLVEARVRSVSRTSARAELSLGAPGVPLGAQGVVLVPAARLASSDEPPPIAPVPSEGEPALPDHPPWTQPPEEWSAETPLLAPAYGPKASEREIDVHGRVWMNATWNQDTLRDRSWQEGRIGAWLDANNLFGRGGGIRFSAQALNRQSDLGPLGDTSNSEAWIDRLSYWEGGTEEEPNRFEIGRFLQKEYPELGFLDGVEFSHRTDSGARFGASFGAMPLPFPGLPSGNDVQAAVFYRALLGSEDELSLGGALQSTWHEGNQDRTLLLASADWTPSARSWVRSIAFVDWYGSDDGPKSTGAELTDFQLQGGLHGNGKWGLSASYRHRRWPYLQRDEIAPISAAEIANSEVDQAWISGWFAAGSKLVFNARLGWWQDEQRDGGDAELGMSFVQPWQGGRIDLAVLASQGDFSSVRPGLRAAVSQSWSSASAALTWGIANSEQENFVGDQAELLQQSVRGSFDWRFAPGWNVNLGAQKLFGDQLDGWIANIGIQRSF